MQAASAVDAIAVWFCTPHRTASRTAPRFLRSQRYPLTRPYPFGYCADRYLAILPAVLRRSWYSSRMLSTSFARMRALSLCSFVPRGGFRLGRRGTGRGVRLLRPAEVQGSALPTRSARPHTYRPTQLHTYIPTCLAALLHPASPPLCRPAYPVSFLHKGAEPGLGSAT